VCYYAHFAEKASKKCLSWKKTVERIPGCPDGFGKKAISHDGKKLL